MSQYSYLSEPDPEFAQLLSVTTIPPRNPDVVIRRAQTAAGLKLLLAADPLSYPPSTLEVKEKHIPVSNDGTEIAARLYIPQPSTELGEEPEHLFPLLVWVHGGGFSVGNPDMDDHRLQRLALDTRLSVVNVDYRLAPEYPFPIGLDDAYATLKWAIVNSKDILRADPSKGFLVGGASSGGNFAAVLSHLVRDDPEFEPKLTGQILQIPVVVASSVVPEKYKREYLSMEQNKDAPYLTAAHIHAMWELYGAPDLADPRVSPLLLPSHKNLPPAFIQVAGLDPLRDDAFLYERILRESGVDTKIVAYPGVPHGFHFVMPQLAATEKHEVDLKEGVTWLLNKSS